MELIHKDDDRKGVFKLKDGARTVAEMTYVWAGEDRFIIDHTEVNPDYEGQGLGLQLVEAAVIFARERNFKIIPLCPFARAMFERHSEFQDVR